MVWKKDFFAKVLSWLFFFFTLWPTFTAAAANRGHSQVYWVLGHISEGEVKLGLAHSLQNWEELKPWPYMIRGGGGRRGCGFSSRRGSALPSDLTSGGCGQKIYGLFCGGSKSCLVRGVCVWVAVTVTLRKGCGLPINPLSLSGLDAEDRWGVWLRPSS